MQETCTPLEEQLCLEYVKDRRLTRAAERAGVAYGSAVAMMSRPRVQERLEALSAQQRERVGVEADRILLELLRVALLDPIDLFDDQGRLKPLDTMPEAARRAIAQLEVTTGLDGQTTTKVKLHGKLEALKMLGQYKQLFSDLALKIQDSNVLVVIEGLEGGKGAPTLDVGPSGVMGGTPAVVKEVAAGPNLLAPPPEVIQPSTPSPKNFSPELKSSDLREDETELDLFAPSEEVDLLS